MLRRGLVHFTLLLLSSPFLSMARAELPSPKILRVYPLSAQRGTQLEVEIVGECLANTTGVVFDSQDLTWLETTSIRSTRLTGRVSISQEASLGPHLVRARTLDGYSKSALFNVSQFASLLEAEPNDDLKHAQPIPQLPMELEGRLDAASDVDYFSIQVRAGDHWSFDLRSIEYGSGLETKLTLLDAGDRRLAYSDDRSDYDESPWIDFTFTRSGVYYLKLDQYRGPRGFNFGKACTYTLRIASLPRIDIVSPLGLRIGQTTRLHLSGNDLGQLQKVYLTPIRLAEYARMTYPYTMPIHFQPDAPRAAEMPQIAAKIIKQNTHQMEVEFTPSLQLQAGLWRLWGRGSRGISEGGTVELSQEAVFSPAPGTELDLQKGEICIDGVLKIPGEQDVYTVRGKAGQLLHFWTLAEQLGLPHIDTVLELRDPAGKKVASNDDVVAGQGSLLGNSDSSLYYTPKEDGRFQLAIKDRLNRGGESYVYRLKGKQEATGFQLFTSPENFTVPRGNSAILKVHLVREAGFEGEVSIWVEGLPKGVESPRGKFRADQLFEPNADGADMIIPEIALQINVPESLPLGDYPIHILGTPTKEEASPNRMLIEAHASTYIGPLLELWNYIRRPLPAIVMTICEPAPGQLSTTVSQMTLRQGESTTLEIKAQEVPEDASIQLMNLPEGFWRELGRQGDQITFMLQAAAESVPGTADITAEARIHQRWISTPPIQLQLLPLRKISKTGELTLEDRAPFFQGTC
ncbi:MAG: pre-peptidase C-terminal domain-containing protein [Terriglobia bacterium]